MKRHVALLLLLVAARPSVLADENARRTNAVKSSEKQETASTSVIDIRAIARQGEAHNGDDKTGTSFSKNSENTIHAAPFVIAFLSSLVGTVVMMYLMDIPSSRKQREHGERGRTIKEASAVDAILAQARLVLQEKTQGSSPARFAFEYGHVDADETSLSLARTFGRAQGELHLLRKFETQHQPYPWEKELKSLQLRENLNHSGTAAKRLGVGKGEVNLAAAIRRMGESESRKESQS